jgi:hypothetical protein
LENRENEILKILEGMSEKPRSLATDKGISDSTENNSEANRRRIHNVWGHSSFY